MFSCRFESVYHYACSTEEGHFFIIFLEISDKSVKKYIVDK